MGTTMVQATTKAEHLEIAARAEFEAFKASNPELADTTWESLPDGVLGDLGGDADDDHVHWTRAFFRLEVHTAVEALWRAGSLRGSTPMRVVGRVEVENPEPLAIILRIREDGADARHVTLQGYDSIEFRLGRD